MIEATTDICNSLRTGSAPAPAAPRARSAPVIDGGAFLSALDAHHRRVGAMAEALARRYGLRDAHATLVGTAAARHDAGKLYLKQKVFELPRRLTDREEAYVRTHTLLGHAALEDSSDPALALAARVALEHHECWDGGGYPFGIAGEAISTAARIVSICDVYDTLRETRGYKHGYTHAEAMAVLTMGDERTRPTMFDPNIMAVVVQDDGRFLDRIVCDAHGSEIDCESQRRQNDAPPSQRFAVSA